MEKRAVTGSYRGKEAGSGVKSAVGGMESSAADTPPHEVGAISSILPRSQIGPRGKFAGSGVSLHLAVPIVVTPTAEVGDERGAILKRPVRP